VKTGCYYILAKEDLIGEGQNIDITYEQSTRELFTFGYSSVREIHQTPIIKGRLNKVTMYPNPNNYSITTMTNITIDGMYYVSNSLKDCRLIDISGIENIDKNKWLHHYVDFEALGEEFIVIKEHIKYMHINEDEMRALLFELRRAHDECGDRSIYEKLVRDIIPSLKDAHLPLLIKACLDNDTAKVARDLHNAKEAEIKAR